MLRLAIKIYQTQFLFLCLFMNISNNVCQSAYERSLAEQNLKPEVLIKTKNLVESNSVEIGIQDNGLGIPQNILDKIFATFFTTKSQGKGTRVRFIFCS